LKDYLNFLHLNIFISKDLMLPMSTFEFLGSDPELEGHREFFFLIRNDT